MTHVKKSPAVVLPRRSFLSLSAALATTAFIPSSLSAAEPPPPSSSVRKRGIKLGFDNYAVRAMNWKAPQLIDYGAQLQIDSIFITDLDAFEKFDDDYLIDLRKKSADHNIQLVLGSWSICPTSKAFKNTWGTAIEHGALAMRIAKHLGSPAARFILGTAADRTTDGGIPARIADTVAVCKALKPHYENLGVKLAIENHAGDMQSAELVELIETAGKDFVGANMDTGNGMWTMEDPMTTIRNLAPYTLTTSLRDTMIWQSDKGATWQWVPMGDGVVDFVSFFDYFEQHCPGVAVHIETIGGFNKEVPYLEPGFFDGYPKQTAADLAAWLRLVRKGKPLPPGKGQFANNQDYQRYQIERSLTYCKQSLGLGLL